MNRTNKEDLKLLLKAVTQINKKLIAINIILSVALSSTLVLFIDFLYDLRLFVYLILIFIFSYIFYKLIFKYKFSHLKKRLDKSSIKEQTSTESFLYLELGNHRLKLNLKDCYYYLTKDFVFAFQGLKLMAIFTINKLRETRRLEDFLTQFKKRKNANFLLIVTIIVIVGSLIWKINLIQVNKSLISKNSHYLVVEIIKDDSILFKKNKYVTVELVNNQLENDSDINENYVEIYFRFEPFKKVRIMYSIFSNVTNDTLDSLSKKIIGLYSYKIYGDKITLFKDNIKLIATMKQKTNPAPNITYGSCRNKLVI